MKFEKIATEPLTGEPENLLEVINQCHTYLVSIKGENIYSKSILVPYSGLILEIYQDIIIIKFQEI